MLCSTFFFDKYSKTPTEKVISHSFDQERGQTFTYESCNEGSTDLGRPEVEEAASHFQEGGNHLEIFHEDTDVK